jgi:hypothetical protein
MVESNQADARMGRTVSGAGDVNGDGFADVIVGDGGYDTGQNGYGAAFVYHGNRHGRPVMARQYRGNGDTTPVQPWGQSYDPDDFQASMTATSPRGRERVKMQVEYCPSGFPFGDVSCNTHTPDVWMEVSGSHTNLTETISGLNAGKRYRWRARVLYAPLTVDKSGITEPPNPAHGPWRRVDAQSDEADIIMDDITAPSAPGTPTDAGEVSTIATVTFSWAAAIDADSGITSYNLQVGTTPGGSDLFSGYIGNVPTYDVIGSDEQTLYARVQAINPHGLIGPWSGNSDGIIIDTSPNAPLVSGTTPTSVNPPTWTWTSGGGPVIGLYRYRLNDPNLNANSDQTTLTYYTPPFALSPEGGHTLYVQETDGAGNWSPTGSHTIEVDSGYPCTTAASPTVVDEQSATFEITYTYDDIYGQETCGSASSGTGLAKVELYVKAPGESEYTLVDTDLPGSIDGTFSYTATVEGSYYFYTLATDNAGNVEDVPDAGYHTKTLYASEFSGYAILSVGSISGEEGLDAHTITANNVYQHLINRNFGYNDPLDPEDIIKYFNPYEGVITGRDDYTINPDDPEGRPIGYNLAMRKAITQWALNHMIGLPGPLYIILIDHGTPDAFSLTATEYFTSIELAGWLDILESDMAAQGINQQPIVIVLGTCYSGSFMDNLSKSGRIIVSSTAADEPSYRGPETPTGVRDGEFFISALFNEWGRGSDLKTSFERAVEQTEAHTDSGYTNSPAPYFDTAKQHPHLDDDGQWPWGSHDLITGSDGDVAADFLLGFGTATPDSVVVTEVGTEPAIPLGPTETQATLWARVSDSLSADGVWVEIREPIVTLEGGTDQQVVDLIEVDLVQVEDRYERLYTGFSMPGEYTLFFYVRDDSGIISPFVIAYVYKEIGDNQSPGAFSLVSPADLSTTTTSAGLGAVWEASVDPDGHPVTYTLEIFTDPGGALFYTRERLADTILVVGPEANFVDRDSYTWRVIAVDEYGAETPSTETWRFSIDNNNPLVGWIQGLVYDTDTNLSIPHAQVSASGLNIAHPGDGSYLGTGPAGSSYTFTVSASGYQSSIVPDVSVLEGTIATQHFVLETEGDDSDGDGSPDREEQGPSGNYPDYDGNADGIADRLQENVTSLHTFDDQNYVTLEVSGGATINNCLAVANPSPDDCPSDVAFPYGFFEFTLEGMGMGGACTVTLYLSAGASFDTYYKCGPTTNNTSDHWYEFLHNGQTGANINGNVITLHFVDGLRGDDDLTANQVIIDVGGPGARGVTLELTPSGGGGGKAAGGCFIDTTASSLSW